MPTFPYRESGFPAAPSGGDEARRRRENLIYEVGTIATILLLLGSIWLF